MKSRIMSVLLLGVIYSTTCSKVIPEMLVVFQLDKVSVFVENCNESYSLQFSHVLAINSCRTT